MIAKAFTMRSPGTSSMRRLVNYITSDQSKAHRIGEIIISNCEYDDPELAMLEMLITQARNNRATSDKTYHLLLSFRPGEDPTPDTLRRVESAICRKLGFEEHQRIAVVHHDTDSVHIHIAINKIHPKKLTIHNPYRDWKDLGEECARLEKMLYLAADNHTTIGRTETERTARDIEALTGEQSLLGWIRKECLPALKTADSWEAFHRELANAGLSIKLQNNGVTFVSASGERIKGSGVDRAFSKSALEKRFGEFQEMPHATKSVTSQKSYRRNPVDASPEAKIEFAQVKEQNEKRRAECIALIRHDQKTQFAVLMAEVKNDRLQARRTHASRPAKKKLYEAINQKYRAKLAVIRRDAQEKRRTVYRESPRYTWFSFLQEQARDGDQAALKKLRARAEGLAKRSGNTVQGEDAALPSERDRILNHPIDGVTKKGTVIYSLGKDTLRDDGEAFRINRDADPAAAILALRVAQQRFGNCLYVTGDHRYRDLMIAAAAEAKLGITFSDPTMEVKRKALMERHAPSQSRGMSRW